MNLDPETVLAFAMLGAALAGCWLHVRAIDMAMAADQAHRESLYVARHVEDRTP